MPITTKVVSLNPDHCEVYSIQVYVIKFVTYDGLVILVSSTNKTGHHEITEILLKFALNTITLTLFKAGNFPYYMFMMYAKVNLENVSHTNIFEIYKGRVTF